MAKVNRNKVGQVILNKTNSPKDRYLLDDSDANDIAIICHNHVMRLKDLLNHSGIIPEVFSDRDKLFALISEAGFGELLTSSIQPVAADPEPNVSDINLDDSPIGKILRSAKPEATMTQHLLFMPKGERRRLRKSMHGLGGVARLLSAIPSPSRQAA